MDATPKEWRPVVGHEETHEVSSRGRVRSLDRVVKTPRGYWHYPGKMLKLSTARKPDYPVVTLGGGKSARVHNLVLEAFCGPRPEGYVACHNNGDPHDNRVENLRWDTYSSNNRDLVKQTRIGSPKRPIASMVTNSRPKTPSPALAADESVTPVL